MTQDKFKYLPLPDGGRPHIRLMKVEDKLRDDIDITIDHFSLEEAPEYTALSYMWGDPARTSPIVANDKELGVTSSLLKFLQETQRRRKASDDCSVAFRGWLWIDAVCINQDDLSERAKQVKQMIAIYERAHNIIIWLGEGEEKSDVAMKVLGHIAAFEEEDLEFRSSEDEPEYMCELVGGNTTIRTPYSVFPILQNLLNSPYWDRSWIIQEASTPKRSDAGTADAASIWVCVGGLSLPFSDYAEANRRLDLATSAGQLRSQIDLRHIANGNLETIQYLENRRFSVGYVSALYPMLVRTRSSLATDPRDKLYAILGLVADGDDPLLDPDYTLDAGDVFTRLSLSIITRSVSLDCLGSAGLARNLDVPSWVTDWSVQSTPSPFYMVDRVFNHDDTVKSESNLFNASKGMLPHVGADLANRRLTGHGFTFDLVAKTSCQRVWPDTQSDDVWLDWLAVIGELAGEYVSGGSTFEALSKVLRADYHDVWGDWSAERGGSTPDFTNFDVNAFELHDGILDSMTWHRRLFVTKKGYLGIAAADVAVDDELCILAGSQMPMILRSVDDEFLFIGQAYVHGIMDGEAVDKGTGKVLRHYIIR